MRQRAGDMDITPDRLRQRVVELLGASPPTWSTVSGTLYSLYDEAVTHPDDVARNAIDDEQFGTLEGWYRFWGTASPWHLRLEKVRQIVPRGRDTAVMPDVLVTDRWTWRARRGRHVSSGRWQPDRILTNREGKRWVVYDEEIMPDPGHWYRSHGLENLDLLLKPAPLLRAFHFADTIPVEHDDRAGIQVRAVPREREEFHWWAPGLVVIGADSYVFTVDAKCGVVLHVSISIRGQLGRRLALSDVRFDDAIDEERFRQSALETDLA